jgi:hypothetical protein
MTEQGMASAIIAPKMDAFAHIMKQVPYTPMYIIN